MARDHYAVLGIERTASEEEVKKAYKKAALQWHPDKNINNKDVAEKRFKEITAAYTVLGSADSRSHYDRYGDDEPRRGGGGGGGRSQHGAGMQPEDLTPEDVFNMFFGIPPGARQQRRHYHYAQPGQSRQRGPARAEANGFALFQLLPILALVVLSFFSSIEIDTAPYELRPSSSHRIERETDGLGLKYFVPESFDLDYAHSRLALRRIEEAVEQDISRTAAKQCGFERKQQQRMYDAAQHYAGAEREAMLGKARAFRLDACDEEERIRAHRRQ
jgi:hypothetical protein